MESRRSVVAEGRRGTVREEGRGLVPLDIEAPPDPSDGHQAPPPGRVARTLFPFDVFNCPCFWLCCCCCCPESVRAWVPGPFRRVKNWTQLVLIFGIWASVLFLLEAADMLLGRLPIPPKCWTRFCGREIVSIIYISPCLYYFIRTLGRFDERLTEKLQAVGERQQELLSAYSRTIRDMETFLGKAAESSAGLAERNFEAKRRDFVKFLERLKSAKFTIGNKEKQNELVLQLKGFVLNWQKAFQECSINPGQNPRIVVSEDDLARLTTIPEVVDLVVARLKVAEVRFISAKQKEDAKMIENKRTSITGMSSRVPGLQAKRSRWPTWIRGPTGKLWFRSAGSDRGFPKECDLLCCQILVLSVEHFYLLGGFIVGWVILALELRVITLAPQGSVTVYNALRHHAAALVITIEVCIGLVLAQFEEIDEIQSLEREIRALDTANKGVAEQREQMQETWNQVQELTDLWLYRTVPRLDLYSVVHNQLEDHPADLLPMVTAANTQLQDLEKKLGGVEVWQGSGNLPLEYKQQFSNAVNRLCQEEDFGKLMTGFTAIADK